MGGTAFLLTDQHLVSAAIYYESPYLSVGDYESSVGYHYLDIHSDNQY